MTVHHVLSQPTRTWTGARDRLDRALLLELAGASLAGAEMLLCGPPQLVSSARRSLRELGVERRRIHAERFAIP